MSRTAQIMLYIYITAAALMAVHVVAHINSGMGDAVISTILLVAGLASCILTLYYFLYFLITRTKGDILLVNAVAATVFIIFFTVLLNTIHC